MDESHVTVQKYSRLFDLCSHELIIERENETVKNDLQIDDIMK